jgi:hypothetical protein
MLDFGISEESIAVMAQQLLSIALVTKEGHNTHMQITQMYLEIFKKLKEEMLPKEATDE